MAVGGLLRDCGCRYPPSSTLAKQISRAFFHRDVSQHTEMVLLAPCLLSQVMPTHSMSVFQTSNYSCL